jgi:hypothetical protein
MDALFPEVEAGAAFRIHQARGGDKSFAALKNRVDPHVALRATLFCKVREMNWEKKRCAWLNQKFCGGEHLLGRTQVEG